jgi:hypothetical protein
LYFERCGVVQKWVKGARDDGTSSVYVAAGTPVGVDPGSALDSEYGGAGNLPTVTGAQADGIAMNRHLLSSTAPVGAGAAATVAADAPSSGGVPGSGNAATIGGPLWPVMYWKARRSSLTQRVGCSW